MDLAQLLSEFEKQLNDVEEQARAIENRRVYLRRTVEGLRGLLGRPVEDRAPMHVERLRRPDGTIVRRYLDSERRVLRELAESVAERQQPDRRLAHEKAALDAQVERLTSRRAAKPVGEVRELRPAAPRFVGSAPTFEAAERTRPKVREAILLILGEIPRVWTLQELVTEMRVRSWLDPDLRAPRETVRAAANRLVERDKLVERMGTRSFRLKQASDEPTEDKPTKGGV